MNGATTIARLPKRKAPIDPVDEKEPPGGW